MSPIQLKIASSDTCSEECPYGLRVFNSEARGLVGFEITGPPRPPQSPPESPWAARARFEHCQRTMLTATKYHIKPLSTTYIDSDATPVDSFPKLNAARASSAQGQSPA